MSYILDPLKKSEEERKKSSTKAAGSGFTLPKDNTPSKNKFAFGLILTSCILLAAIILGGGWWWSQQDHTETVDSKIETQRNTLPNTDTVGQDIEVDPAPAKQ